MDLIIGYPYRMCCGARRCSCAQPRLAKMKLFKTTHGIVIEDDTGAFHLASPSTAPPPPVCPPVDWDTWTNRDDLHAFLLTTAKLLPTISATEFASYTLLAPIGSQEVWCAGVTYKNSQVERMKESDTPDFCEHISLVTTSFTCSSPPSPVAQMSAYTPLRARKFSSRPSRSVFRGQTSQFTCAVTPPGMCRSQSWLFS